MARELSQIISELNNVYDPQRQTVRQQQEAIDPALQAEEKGLEYAKNDAFQGITDTANRRGLFYSGIPIAEQQKYTGGTYLPAVANLRGKYQQQRFNLQDTLNKIQSDQYNQAYGVRQKEVDADNEMAKFREQLAAQERASRAAAAGGGGGASPSFNLGGGGGAARTSSNLGDPIRLAADQKLYNQMFIRSDGQKWDNQSLVNDYNATLKSARYGNAADQRKIQFYHTFQPGLFGANVPSFAAPKNTAVPNLSGKPNGAVNFATGPLRR